VRLNRPMRGALAAALLLAAGVAGAGQGAEKAIRAVEEQRIEAMIAGDLATLDRLLADELTYVHSNGQVETKAEFLGRIKSGDLKYRSVRREDVRVRVEGRAAVVTGRAAMEVRSKGEDLSLQMRFTDVYVERGGRWKLLAWQSTRLQ
jgi:ketosteroid isomerase-like protein